MPQAIASAFLASLLLPEAAAAQAPSATAAPVSAQTIAMGLEPSDGLEFAWGLEVRTGRGDLVDFTGYAMNWSSLRIADGRILSIALAYEPGSVAPVGLRQIRLDHGIPSSTPVVESRVFVAPADWPRVEGHRFLDGFRVSSGASPEFVGLWASETSPERLLIAFDDPATAREPQPFTILGRTEMEADVVSASAPLHGGSPLISVATRPTVDGAFTILTYRWRTRR